MEAVPHRAGFVTIVGKPNVGKSTLMNELVGERLSIITPKAQTTRHNIAGIVNGPHFQIVYTDTPGILKPAYKLQASMMHALTDAMVGTDVLLWLVDIYDQEIPPIIAKALKQQDVPILLVINKVDLVADQITLEELVQDWQKKVQVAKVIPIAALHRFQVDQVLKDILTYLPEHPPYYPKDMLTDKTERFLLSVWLLVSLPLIFSCSLSIPPIRASGLGGQPGTYTSTGIIRSTPFTTWYPCCQ